MRWRRSGGAPRNGWSLHGFLLTRYNPRDRYFDSPSVRIETCALPHWWLAIHACVFARERCVAQLVLRFGADGVQHVSMWGFSDPPGLVCPCPRSTCLSRGQTLAASLAGPGESLDTCSGMFHAHACIFPTVPAFQSRNSSCAHASCESQNRCKSWKVPCACAHASWKFQDSSPSKSHAHACMPASWESQDASPGKSHVPRCAPGLLLGDAPGACRKIVPARMSQDYNWNGIGTAWDSKLALRVYLMPVSGCGLLRCNEWV